MAVTVTVDGAGDLNRRLRRAAQQLPEAARSAVLAEAEEVADDMRSAAPVDTGDLRDSIIVRGGGELALVGPHGATPPEKPWVVEHGTSRSPAQPYIAPAAAASRGRFPGRLRRAIEAAAAEQ